MGFARALAVIALCACGGTPTPDAGAGGGEGGGGVNAAGGGDGAGGGGAAGGGAGGGGGGSSGFCTPSGWRSSPLADAGVAGTPLALKSSGDTLYLLAGDFLGFRFAQRAPGAAWQQDRSSVARPFNSTVVATTDSRGELHAALDLTHVHRLPDAGWERREVVSSPNLNRTAPNVALAVEPNGTVHIAFGTQGSTQSAGVYDAARGADGGWAVTPVVTAWPYTPSQPAIAYDPSFGAVIVCSNTQPGLDCDSPGGPDGGWFRRYLFPMQFLPSLWVGPDGALHVVSSGGQGSLTYYRHEPDGGSSQQASLEAASSSPAAISSKVASDPSGNTHVVWLAIASGGAQALRYARVSANGTVTATATLACGTAMKPIENWDLTWTSVDGPVVAWSSPDTGGMLAMP